MNTIACVTRHHYFADYEILWGGRFTVWGQATLTYEIDDLQAFNPADVVERIHAQAATKHGVTTSEVRIRALHRL